MYAGHAPRSLRGACGHNRPGRLLLPHLTTRMRVDSRSCHVTTLRVAFGLVAVLPCGCIVKQAAPDRWQDEGRMRATTACAPRAARGHGAGWSLQVVEPNTREPHSAATSACVHRSCVGGAAVLQSSDGRRAAAAPAPQAELLQPFRCVHVQGLQAAAGVGKQPAGSGAGARQSGVGRWRRDSPAPGANSGAACSLNRFVQVSQHPGALPAQQAPFTAARLIQPIQPQPPPARWTS